MRFLSTLALAVVTFAPAAFGHSTHRSHIVNTDGDTEIRIIKDDDGQRASFRRDGVRYVTTDRAVIAEIEKAMETHRQLSSEHSRLGRRHSHLGREHSQLGREHSRLGREHSRVGRTDGPDAERQQRALEEEQRKLEAKQRRLEDRQRDLEAEQRELEAKSRAAEKQTHRAIEKIFDRAIRDGKAKRD